MKKSLLFAISLVFVLAFSFACFAEYYGNPIDSGSCGKDGDNVVWTMYDSGTLVISGQGEMRDDYSDYYWWDNSAIYDYRCYFNTMSYNTNNSRGILIKKIIIEEGVTSIGAGSFWGYLNEGMIIEVYIPDSVKKIGDYAFYNMPVRVEKISNNLEQVGKSVFSFDKTVSKFWTQDPSGLIYIGNALIGYKSSVNNEDVNLYINDGTIAISSDTFGKNSNIRNIYIPKTVKELDRNIFTLLEKATVSIDLNNPYMCVDEYGVIYNADKTKLIAAPANLYYGAYVIPDTVIEICDGAFYGSKQLYSVQIDSSVKKIGKHAFYDCDSLSSVTIPGNVEIVDCYAFCNCDNLERVNLLYGVEYLYDGCFSSCKKLSEINLPNSLKSVARASFSHLPSLKEIDIPESVSKFIVFYSGTDVPAPVFGGCTSLETVYLSKIYSYDRLLMSRYFCKHAGDYVYPNLKNVYVKNLSSEEILEISNDIINTNNNNDYYRDMFPAKPKFLPIYVGSKINSYLNTDIVARIDGTPIRSYNIDGYTVIIAEDLKNYGFNVNFDNEKRILYVDDVKGEITSTYTDSAFSGKVGDVAGDVLYTDIDTYVNGLPVKSYNIGGLTAIYISDLQCFGSVVWNENERTICLTRS